MKPRGTGVPGTCAGLCQGLRKHLWHQLSEAVAPAKGLPKGQWPGTSETTTKTWLKEVWEVKEKGKAENAGRPEATQDGPEYLHRMAQSEPLQHALPSPGPSTARTESIERGCSLFSQQNLPFSPDPPIYFRVWDFFFLFYDSAREFGVTDGKSKRYKLTDTREIPKSLLSERVYVILSLWGLEIQLPFFKA